ncbi:hypothetical protein A3A84_00120 [Candidatus Collierbacteria bacterium RIFCSPLOWO2_01_FULL_50_23]|uniref:Sporulation protein YhbH n=1 Tax=Candidatus Collierbacteria bacterium RIFCSPHIGHO2_01_FULL_50_25 TaxID=1817722 RepID=A0A1F5EVE2_9BACT|nr:MAG: hypothetical protein A2703_00770 [Candidatus Collierbacteria bacterium RIFCSPHIGHO2_01_FULL_50_25]OGD74210.1 MAG: hypothetical protein A3A84_00120 [Candidatus Collierbacteria bacterium RIFCSPLOWO2_01_FULL_50_23]
MPRLESERCYISQQDWSLHRKGQADEERMNRKVKEAIKGNLPGIISDGTIISTDPTTKKTIRVPLRAIELPHIIRSRGNEGVGSGDGSEEEGDVIGSRPVEGPGSGQGAGNAPGEEILEAELTIEELRQLVFEDLGLPDLRPKAIKVVESDEVTFDDVRKKRTPTNLDLRRTIEENMKRNALQGRGAVIDGIEQDDYRVRTWNIKERESEAAVLIMMRDISGSMGDFENYIVRSFCWWTVLFLRSKFPHVELVFIVHDTEAYRVTEEEFFGRKSSGGTECSSANQMAHDCIVTEFPTEDYNVYPLHFSDGDNYGTDEDAKCVDLVQAMLDLGVNQYAFVQIAKANSDLLRAYRSSITDDRFSSVTIQSKEEIWEALQTVFDKDKEYTTK